jgi:hypothetical protein
MTDITDLSSNVTNFMHRADLATYIPTFIQLAETEFNRRLRNRQQEVTVSTTPTTGGAFALPTDYLTWKNVGWSTGGVSRSLDYVNIAELTNLYPDSPAANPRVFSILGTTDTVGQLQVMPTDSSAIAFTYYQKIPSLTTTTGTTGNWLLTAHPDVYLAGCMTEACVFAKDFDTAAIWKTRRDALIDGIIELDKQTRGPSSIRPRGWTP